MVLRGGGWTASTLLYNAGPCHQMQCDATQCNAYNTMQRSAVHYEHEHRGAVHLSKIRMMGPSLFLVGGGWSPSTFLRGGGWEGTVQLFRRGRVDHLHLPMQDSTTQHDATQDNATQYIAKPHYIVRHHTIQYDACDTKQDYRTHYNATQHTTT